MIISLFVEDEVHLANYKDNVGKDMDLKFVGKKEKIKGRIKRVNGEEVIVFIDKPGLKKIKDYLNSGHDLIEEVYHKNIDPMLDFWKDKKSITGEVNET